MFIYVLYIKTHLESRKISKANSACVCVSIDDLEKHVSEIINEVRCFIFKCINKKTRKLS